MDEFSDGTKINSDADNKPTLNLPELSEWQCFLFGNRPNGAGLVYRPRKDGVPNAFARWMMRVCFDCLWIKDKDK